MMKLLIIVLFLIAFLPGCIEPIEESGLLSTTSEIIDHRDGQRYKIVKIGDQWWMAENLNYYTNYGSWYYNNDSLAYANAFGRLYLYETIMAGAKSSSENPSDVTGISPPGWHIPSEEEWKQLAKFLAINGYTVDDLKIKGTELWGDQNQGTNALCFNLKPGGTIYDDGKKSANLYKQTTFLTSTHDSYLDAARGVVINQKSTRFMYYPVGKLNGWSLRCVKDID